MDYDLTFPPTTAEPTRVPTKTPTVNAEPYQWSPSSPAPTDAPNTVRRLQLWTCCKPEPTETTEEHRNSKLTWDPTEEPTPSPTFYPGFCGNGLKGCSYYANECEPYCACDWERGFETCDTNCNLGAATVCISCLSGYTLSGGECHKNSAFTADEVVDDDDSDFWTGTGIGFAFCAVMVLCVGMMVFWWRNWNENKAVVTMDAVGDHDDIKLTDAQQLEVVDTTKIELNESVDLHETKPMDIEE